MTEAPFDTMVCRDCGRPLSRLHTPDGMARWLHLSDPSHDAVPVPLGTVPTVCVCDFCSDPRVDRLFLVETFDLTEIAIMGADPFGTPRTLSTTLVRDWGACSDCAALIDRGLWRELLTRVRASMRAKGLRRPPTGLLEEAYFRLRENLIGSVDYVPEVPR